MRGSVAGSGYDIAALAFAAGGEVNGCADCIARALRASDKLELDPVVLEGKPSGVAEAWLFRAGERYDSRRTPCDR